MRLHQSSGRPPSLPFAAAICLGLLWTLPLPAQAAAQSRRVVVATANVAVTAEQGRPTTISVDFRGVPLADALGELIALGVPLIYSSELVRHARSVSCVECNGLAPEIVLGRMLLGTSIQVRKLPSGEFLLVRAAPSRQPAATVRGRVVDAESGVGIEQVTVQVVGTRLRTFTNANGSFDIVNVPSGPRTLRIIRLGYRAAERNIDVPATGDVTLPPIALERLPTQLNPMEVNVSTGSMAETERKKIGNAIVVISEEEILQSGARDLPEVLRGRATGVGIARNSGANGAGGAIMIRGAGSIIQDGTPLVYIDGVPVDVGASALNGRGLHSFSGPDPNAGSQLRIDELTLDQIDRIEIIKGPAATTLYGTQGANGVIQIFTKRGVPGQTRIVVSAEQGMSRLRTDDEYGADLPFREQFLSQFRTPRVQEYRASVSGGSGDVSYSVAGSHGRDAGYIPRNGETRTSLTTSFRAVATPELSVQLSGSIVRRDFESAALYLGSGRTSLQQGLESVPTTNTAVDRMYGAFSLSFQPSHMWMNNLTVGLDNNSEVNDRVGPSPDGIFRDRVSRDFRRASVNVVSTLSYPFRGPITATTSIGGEAFHDVTTRLRLRGVGLPSTEVTDFDLATTIQGGDQGLPTDLSTKVAQVGAFFQEQLGIYDRLFLTAGLRADGNSSFGDNYGIQLYPKVAASYVFEPTTWWDAKLRTAWGQSGQAPPPFAKDLVFGLRRAVTGPLIGMPIQELFDLGNPDLRPELRSEWEIGTENYFFGNRASVEMNYFRQNTRDAHLRAPVPLSTGLLAGPLTNVGELRSSGLELALRVTPVERPSTSLDLAFTLTRMFEDGLITKLGNDPVLTRYNQGFELGTFEGLREGFSVRDLYFTSVFSDTVTEGYSGREIVRVGRRVPTTYGGATMNLRFAERARLYGTFSYNTGGYGFDHTRFITDRALGYLGTAPNSGYSINGLPPELADRYIFRTDQVKVEVLRLSYLVPSTWMQSVANEAEVWLEGNNIYSRDVYDRGDPEGVPVASSGVGYTGMRQIVAPRPQMYKLGVRMTF